MESTSIFPGDQSQQGNEKIMDTGTFTLGNTILNRYPALSTHTYQGMGNSNMEAFPSFNYFADATPQMDIQPPTRKCNSQTSVHFQDSLSNKPD